MTLRLLRHDPGSARDPYASGGYGQAAARASNGEWVCIVDDTSGWRLALVLADGPRAREAASPYGYAGISIGEHLNEQRRDALWSDALSLLAAEDVVTLFLRFPPYQPNAARLASTLPGLELRHASNTILVPTTSADTVWTGMAGRARTAIRKATNAGLVGEVRIADPAIAAADGEFRRLYDATMERLDAPSHLRFDEEYYERLIEALGSSLLVATVRSEGESVAACLLISDSQVLHYHLSGSDSMAARLGANNLMLWTALRDAAHRGHAAMHLGGGTRRGDSLFQFKASFGGDVVPFHVGRAIVDRERYAMLLGDRALELGVAPDVLIDSDYFPAFRAVPRVVAKL